MWVLLLSVLILALDSFHFYRYVVILGTINLCGHACIHLTMQVRCITGGNFSSNDNFQILSVSVSVGTLGEIGRDQTFA